MNIRPATDAYLADAERFAGRKFQYRIEMGTLIDLANQRSLPSLFEELIFLAKFASNSYNILKRSGIQRDETANLTAEFSGSLQKISSLLGHLIAEAPAEVVERFRSSFLDFSHDNMDQLMALLHELSWIKSYTLDHHPPPFSAAPNS